jgi:hypothetical protein
VVRSGINRKEVLMPTVALIVVAIVITGFVVFAGVLAWTNWYANSGGNRSHQEPAE